MAKAKTSRKGKTQKPSKPEEPKLVIPRHSWITQSLIGATELTDDNIESLDAVVNGCEKCKKPNQRSPFNTAQEYVQTGKCNIQCTTSAGVFGIIIDKDEAPLAIAPDGKLFWANYGCRQQAFKEKLLKDYRISPPCAAAVMFNGGLTIIQNGDDVDDTDGINGLEALPTISFRCLARFFTKNQSTATDFSLSKTGFQLLNKGTILDFSPDEIRKLTANQQERFKKAKSSNNSISKRANAAKLFPPEPGFVLTRKDGYVWHRSGSFLFAYKGIHVLMGVDETTYFGCELADPAKTLKAAYESLIPQSIRKLNCPRQGEWFAVATDKKYDRHSPEVLAFFDEECGCNCDETWPALPIDHPDAAYHRVRGDLVVITKEGLIAKNPTLMHSTEDHTELELTGWYRFVRNTAKRSFSEEGVD
jgi:hypothetical protein